jgi:AcrR family transcriptional regulator
MATDVIGYSRISNAVRRKPSILDACLRVAMLADMDNPVTGREPSALHTVRESVRGSFDPRVDRTRKKIRAALRDIESDIGAAPLTATALARAAGMARSGFYTHYSSVDELAIELLGEAFDLIGTADLVSRRQPERSGRDAARIALQHLVTHFSEHRALYVGVFGLRLSAATHTRVVAAYADHVERTLALVPDAFPVIGRRFVAEFTASGTIEVLTSWLRREVGTENDSLTSDDLVDLLLTLQPPQLTDPEPTAPPTGIRQ